VHKLVVLYPEPADPEHFHDYYVTNHLSLAQARYAPRVSPDVAQRPPRHKPRTLSLSPLQPQHWRSAPAAAAQYVVGLYLCVLQPWHARSWFARQPAVVLAELGSCRSGCGNRGGDRGIRRRCRRLRSWVFCGLFFDN
jgi:hypothetical protein